MTRDTTLSTALMPTDRRWMQALLVVAGSMLVTLGAQIEVPMFPVPMSLQTLAIAIVGLTLGARMATAAVVLYLVQGAAGFPVFSGGDFGVIHLLGPTGGFLFGFIGQAWLTGWLAEHGFGRGLGRLFVAALVPTLLLYIPGTAWLWAVTPLALTGAVQAAVLPFVPGAFVKMAIAALVVAGGWQAVSRRKG